MKEGNYMKQRNIVLSIILTLCTCGIYGWYWLVCITNDVNELSGESDTSGGMVLLFSLLTCGIYSWFWAYKLGQKLDMIAQNAGKPVTNRSLIFLVLNLLCLGLITYAIAQSEINSYITAE